MGQRRAHLRLPEQCTAPSGVGQPAVHRVFVCRNDWERRQSSSAYQATRSSSTSTSGETSALIKSDHHLLLPLAHTCVPMGENASCNPRARCARGLDVASQCIRLPNAVHVPTQGPDPASCITEGAQGRSTWAVLPDRQAGRQAEHLATCKRRLHWKRQNSVCNLTARCNIVPTKAMGSAQRCTASAHWSEARKGGGAMHA